MSGAEAVLSNETGTIHLAAALGTPAVCIAGGGDFGHMIPYPEDLDTGGRPLP
ncbi:MAG TPA: lipopolysaccharide heptosyltransferase family protein, partial [Desulfobacteraceae bacterium]|nr:lipopolysaccharide heptosyltransferase family protein [Desulfobacteraceae bacterium]